MKFKDQIYQLNNKLSNIPSGYKRLGNVAIFRSTIKLGEEFGKAVLEILPWCESVFQQINTVGEERQPILIHIYGSNNYEVIHSENNVKYILDFSKITFSGGNRGLRERLVNDVNENEQLVDMFAAIGNLSLQVLYHKKVKGILIEKNPYTFKYLKKTLEFNKLSHINIINDDCRNVELNNWADRIFMGYHEVDESHLAKALLMAKEHCTIHLHPIVHVKQYSEIQEKYISIIEENRAHVESVKINRIKNYAPKLEH
ncbi:MAG: hypothetical protein OEY49_02960, partial [Candidatus Heimdallarchaeota archaeon]|nr:hypothetical protein [Candidatus Heimdallarchaeota archaeon]